MASIREVAKLAGVSPATVSRVMNGTANVDDEKKQRVLKAIEETGFRPNELARALFKKSSKIIGVIVPNIDNPFFSEAARAIEDEAFKRGYKMIVCNSNNDPERELNNIEMLVQMKADGLILMTNGEETGKNIEQCEIPVVVMDRKLSSGDNMVCIESDHYKGGCLATEHLIKCGCKKILSFKGPEKYSSGKERFRGYIDTCKKFNREALFVDCDYSYTDGLRAAQEVLDQYPDLDGIVACNDMSAMAAYKILSKAGIRIPEDVQLVGFDDISFSKRFTPELTTIHQPIKEMGCKAVQMILQSEEELKKEQHIVLDVSLIERETTLKIKEEE